MFIRSTVFLAIYILTICLTERNVVVFDFVNGALHTSILHQIYPLDFIEVHLKERFTLLTQTYDPKSSTHSLDHSLGHPIDFPIRLQFPKKI